MKKALSNQVILLTGGAIGVGRECALADAPEGAAVGVVDRDVEGASKTATTADNNSLAIEAEVANGNAIEFAFEELVGVFLLSHQTRFITRCILPVSGEAEIGYRR